MATTSSESPIALVTGCSTGGIGPELALFLVHSGYIVYASARKLSNMPDELAAAGCRLLELDVCRSESLEAARDKISAAHGGRFNLLINNAGQGGWHIPVMDTDLDAARELFEVNFIGLIASCQTFGTMLARTANSGRGDTRATILNTGSLVGVRGFPLRGIYSASKSAVHALSDSLRTEMQPLGVHVCCSITGGVRSQVGPKAKDMTKRGGKPTSGLYDHLKEAIHRSAQSMRERQVKSSCTPKDYAAAIMPQVISATPPAFVYGGSHIGVLKYVLPVTPAWLTDRFVIKQQGFEGLFTYKAPEAAS